MIPVQTCSIPQYSILEGYLTIPGAYVDAYTTEVDRLVTFPEFISTFYTTPLFKMERCILSVISLPSTDQQARDLADGTVLKFAAWTVENRRGNELLMCDFVQRTRSWLMIRPEKNKTHLYFGTAVVPGKGRSSLEPKYRMLLGFHQLYSKLLLRSARARLTRGK